MDENPQNAINAISIDNNLFSQIFLSNNINKTLIDKLKIEYLPYYMLIYNDANNNQMQTITEYTEVEKIIKEVL